MDNSKISWCILILGLFFTTFGIFWCCTLSTTIFTFGIGLLSLLYVQQGEVDKFFQKCAGNPLNVKEIEGGLNQIVNRVQKPCKLPKSDRRVTGSELIDTSLQEILGYIIRDYVTPWYNLISTDQEFPEVTVRNTSQMLAINISNKIKEVDWIPYLTTKLVDDVASHLRLFKQARLKLEKNNKINARDQRSSPAKRPIHKRNKSEADITQCTKESGNSKLYVPDLNKNNLEDHFFELECQMENNTICRDWACKDDKREKEFLSELVELMLYILLPDEDFQCKSLRFVLREIFATSVILPVFTMISNPDFINQTIIWLCARENYLPSDIFLTVLRFTDNCDELKYTKELITKEIQQLRSRDSGGESDISIKQQLSSLFYVSKLIESRLLKLQSSGPSDCCTKEYNGKLENVKNIKLPLEVILKNNIALSYFIDYVTPAELQTYLFFYHNIEGWKASVEQQLSDLHINKIKSTNENYSSIYENVRSTALSIYEQYLGEKSQHRLPMKSSLVQALFFRIRNVIEPPSVQWFDDIQITVYEILQKQEEFLPSFQSSTAYIKLLAELDLIQQNIEEDSVSLSSLDNAEEEKPPVTQPQNFLTVDSSHKVNKHVRSFSDITTFATNSDNELNGTAKEIQHKEEQQIKEVLKVGNFTLGVEIIETGIVSEKGKTFGVYAIHAKRQYETGFSEDWHIYRRYSDFYDLYMKVKDKYPTLSKLPFPGKKTFHNMDRVVLERRMRMLGSYLQQLCELCSLSTYHTLRKLLMAFLEQGDYDRVTTGGPISNTIDTIVYPLKSGMKTIKNMPEQFISTVDEVVEGLSKVFHGKSNHIPEASKVGASLDIESDDNIPLRIILLLMDEIFDLKSRNQWLRRRIVTLLRQIVRTMFGDIVNRRIVEYVSYITSPRNVAQYLHNFKHSFWPNGAKVDKSVERDEATCARTRVAAKAALLSWLSDDLKHIIGSETTRRGFLTIFELFQRPTLNRRLLYVLLEGILMSLFPEKDICGIFQKLHVKSPITKHCDIKKNG